MHAKNKDRAREKKKCPLIDTLLFSVIIIGVIWFTRLHLVSPNHAVWKSTALNDTTQMDTLAVRLQTFISKIHLIDPHKPVWKSFTLDNAIEHR